MDLAGPKKYWAASNTDLATTAHYHAYVLVAADVSLTIRMRATPSDSIIQNLETIVGRSNVLSSPDELLVYECDGLPQHKYLPRAVVFPSSTEEVSDVMRELARVGVPFTPRGAGTGLSGGALALNRGVVIELARMRKFLKIDAANRTAVVQTGVVNLHVSRAVAHLGLHYVPDPSSQPTCTIGGNIAENAGGIHCLKYGTTTDHVLGVRVVFASGEVVELGGETETPGYDLLGVFIGSEGTFGIATEATLRLVPIPPAVRTLLAEFDLVDDASHAVSAIIAAGVMPAALEMMDAEIIRAVEASVFAAGLSQDVGAALLIELDGLEAGIDDEADRVKSICLRYGARNCRHAVDEAERKKLWAARKGAFGAIGRISPDSMIQDAVVPRSRLPEVLADAYRISTKYQLRLANVFHAGDGNLHPLICFDSRFPDQVKRVKDAGRELMETCVRAGGSITGEHGVGFDKRELLPLIFSESDMDVMMRVRAAFDPAGLCNPGKIIPMLRGCGEARAVVSIEPAEAEVLGSPAGSDAELLDSTYATSQVGKGRLRPLLSETTRPESGGVSTEGGQAGLLDSTYATSQVGKGRLRPLLFETWPLSTTPSSRLLFDPVIARQRMAKIIGDRDISESNLPNLSPAPLLVSPSSIEQMCEIMKLASSEGWAVVPSGAGTWLDADNPLERANLIVSSVNLNRIVEHVPADLIAVAGAGVTLDNLNRELGENGQWLPLDPPDDGRATVGGVVATGLGGAQQFGYGAPRRHVIGMKVVLADGSLVKAGGKVVKNVAGYDLCKLFTGSYGTLGVIVEVNFKLRPLPFETRTLMARGERGHLLAAARQVIQAPLFPVAVEMFSPRLAKQKELGEGEDHLLLLRFSGSLSAVTEQVNDASALLSSYVENKLSPVRLDDKILWKSVASLPVRRSDGLVSRVSLRPSDMQEFLEKLDSSTTARSQWQASLGDGRTRIFESSQEPDKLEARLQKTRALAESFGGRLIIEHGPADLKQRSNAWSSLGDASGVMRRIKQQLDPNQILSPGRFSEDLSS